MHFPAFHAQHGPPDAVHAPSRASKGRWISAGARRVLEVDRPDEAARQSLTADQAGLALGTLRQVSRAMGLSIALDDGMAPKRLDPLVCDVSQPVLPAVPELRSAKGHAPIEKDAQLALDSHARAQLP